MKFFEGKFGLVEPVKDLLKLTAYGLLAQFWTDIGTRGEMDEEEAKELLLLQKILTDEFDKTLQPHLDADSMRDFREYVETFKVRIWFGNDKKAARYLGQQRKNRKT